MIGRRVAARYRKRRAPVSGLAHTLHRVLASVARLLPSQKTLDHLGLVVILGCRTSAALDVLCVVLLLARRCPRPKRIATREFMTVMKINVCNIVACDRHSMVVCSGCARKRKRQEDEERSAAAQLWDFTVRDGQSFAGRQAQC